MSQLIATIVISAVIISLFVLDGKAAARHPKALWIPIAYFFIICSRPVSAWMGGAPPDAVYSDGIYSSPIDQAVTLFLLAMGLIALAGRRTKVTIVMGQCGPLLVFYAYSALSMLWSDFPYLTLKHWIKAVEDVIMILIIWTDPDPMGAIRRLLTRAGFVLIPLSLLFSKYYPNLGRSFNKDWDILYNGVAETKNELGVICLVFGLTALWCFLDAWKEPKSSARRRRLIAHCILMGLVLVMLGMAHCMTASVCLTLTSAVMLVMGRRQRGANVVRVHVAAAAALCSALVPMFVAPQLVQSVGRDPTFSGRTAIWHVLPTLVRNPWLGAGYETFLMGPRLEQLKAIIDKTFQEAHNGYMEVWLNLGWIGVLLFALVLISGYKKVASAFRLNPVIGNLRLAFFLAVVIEGLTEAAFRMMSPTWFLLLLAIVGNSIALPSRPRRERKRRSRKTGDWWAAEQEENAAQSEIPASVIMRSRLTEI